MVSKRANQYGHCKDCPSKDNGIFCELQSISLDEVSKHKVTNTFKKGQTLFVEGTPPFGLYCISKGNIKISKMVIDGKDSIVRIATDGDILGHRSIFTDQYYSATATALEETSVCFISELKSDGVLSQEGKSLFIEDEQRLIEFANLGY